MPYNKRTNLFKQILFSRTMALFLIFLIIFVGFGVFNIVGKSIEASRQRKVTEAEAASVLSKQADLTTKLDALNTPEGEESALREQYPVVSPGEHVVIINDGTEDSASAPAVATAPGGSGFWGFLKSFFRKSPSAQ